MKRYVPELNQELEPEDYLHYVARQFLFAKAGIADDKRVFLKVEEAYEAAEMMMEKTFPEIRKTSNVPLF